MPKTPSYRRRKGYTQAIVTLTDSASGKRRDYWLGEFGTRESREAYHRVLSAWEAAGRRLPETAAAPLAPTATPSSSARTIDFIMREYWRVARSYYTPSAANGVKMALRVLREHHGSTDAAAFGPNALRLVRDAMVRGRDSTERPREPWCRKTANTRVGHIVRMFKWAASRELVSPTVYQALQTLPPLKRGRDGAVDHAPVKPVEENIVRAMLPHVSRPVAALIDLQLLTGARPGELLLIRACDIDTTTVDGAWVYRPLIHKTTHRGIERAIHFGPKAQAILAEFMSDRPLDAYLFSPADAEVERRARAFARRKTPLSCGNSPGTNQRESPARTIGSHYTTPSYRRAIERGCDAAFPPPEALRPRKLLGGRKETDVELLARLTPAQRAELAAWRARHRWHPHQLRHTAATAIRRECGLEVAGLVLGHSSSVLTDQVYAVRDSAKVVEAMRRIG